MSWKRPSELRIEPYEIAALRLAPDTPLRAPVVFHVAGPPFKLGGPFAMRRVRSDGGYDIWVARACRAGAPLLSFAVGDDRPRTLRSALHAGDFYRVLWFDVRGRLIQNSLPARPFARLMLFPEGTLHWDKNASFDERTSFSWRSRRNSQKAPSVRWRAGASDVRLAGEIAKMLADEGSDCAFSWRWMQLSEAERRRQMWNLKNGDWDECEAVLRAIAWRDWTVETEAGTQEWQLYGPAIGGIENATWRGAGLEQTGFWAGDWERVDGYLRRLNRKPSAAQWELLKAAYTRFGWHLDPRFRDKTAIKPELSCAHISFHFEVCAPTFHEQIEAGVFLRKWADR